jgi:hypothetical protein
MVFGNGAFGGRYGTPPWANHRSSNLGAWPVVSIMGAPVASGAGALAWGKVTIGGWSGVVLWSPDGAADLSYCWGVRAWFSANATPVLTTTVAAATKMAGFLMGCVLRSCSLEKNAARTWTFLNGGGNANVHGLAPDRFKILESTLAWWGRAGSVQEFLEVTLAWWLANATVPTWRGGGK